MGIIRAKIFKTEEVYPLITVTKFLEFAAELNLICNPKYV